MSLAAFLQLVGPELRHITRADNLPGIRALGILRPAKLGEIAEVSPAVFRLRPASHEVRLDGMLRARLTSQAQLLAGQGQDFLDDGLTLADWSDRLDARVFFWPEGRGEGFRASLGVPTATIRISSEKLYGLHGPRIDLSPLHTGKATGQPARRGDWAFVPAADSEIFPGIRKARGLVQGADRVVEVSLRADLTAASLSFVLAAPLPTGPDPA
ncbi:MAG: DUF7002 family protein [Gemmobacter sp.]